MSFSIEDLYPKTIILSKRGNIPFSKQKIKVLFNDKLPKDTVASKKLIEKFLSKIVSYGLDKVPIEFLESLFDELIHL